MINWDEFDEARRRNRGPDAVERFIEATRRWWPDVLKWAELTLFNMGHARICAEDVFQDYQVAIYKSAMTSRLPDNAGQLASYCRTTMRNRAMDHIRSCRVVPQYGLSPKETNWKYAPDPIITFNDICKSGVLVDSQLTLLLLWVEGHSATEMAAELGTTPGAIRTRLARIFAKLRKEFKISMEASPNGRETPDQYSIIE